MERWQQDFDFYIADRDDQPASFVIDLNADAHAPVASHPVSVRIYIPMLQPRPDGLRDASELVALGALEDQFVDALETKVDAIYVGRMIHDGATLLFFYVPMSHRDDVQELPTLTGPAVGDYVPRWTVDDDPQWTHHAGLQPNAYARQGIWNRRLLHTMAEHGDQPALPRPIDHLAYFPSEDAAARAHSGLTALGFACDEVAGSSEPDDTASVWSLEFHRDDVLDGDRADAFVGQILDVILPLDGTYDGWGAELRLPT
jgi:regulator of RNase E activity RraB